MCVKCEQCKSGKYNLCEKVKFFATPPIDGGFQEYVSHSENLCFKLPDNVSTLEGALIEPLSVDYTTFSEMPTLTDWPSLWDRMHWSCCLLALKPWVYQE